MEICLEFNGRTTCFPIYVEERHWPEGVRRVAPAEVDYGEYDLAILITDHDDLDYGGLQAGSLPVLDTRNRLVGRCVERL